VSAGTFSCGFAIKVSFAGSLSTGNETILIVEDQPALLDVMSEYLASMGYKTLKAQDGDTALRVAAAHVGPIHVLLTDVIMPGIRGPELATQMTKLRTEVLNDIHVGIFRFESGRH
jgi:two-component system, cell cycle sensor histidine kinase and response regulator CckA